MADKHIKGFESLALDDTFLRLTDNYGDNIIIKTLAGNNDNLSVADGDTGVWGLSKDFTFLTENTQLFISSSSTSDISCVVLIEYLDEDFNPHTTIIVTNGQNNVTLAVSDMLTINQATVVSGATNIGNLYIHTNVSGITVGVPDDLDDVNCFLDAGTGRAHMARFTSYSGYQTILKQTVISASTLSVAGNADRTRVDTRTNIRLESGIIIQATKQHIGAGAGQSQSTTIFGGSLDEKQTLFVTASTNIDNAQISYTFVLWLIKDSFIEKVNKNFGFE